MRTKNNFPFLPKTSVYADTQLCTTDASASNMNKKKNNYLLSCSSGRFQCICRFTLCSKDKIHGIMVVIIENKNKGKIQNKVTKPKTSPNSSLFIENLTGQSLADS